MEGLAFERVIVFVYKYVYIYIYITDIIHIYIYIYIIYKLIHIYIYIHIYNIYCLFIYITDCKNKRVLEYGVVFYGNPREQTGENGFPRIPTGILLRFYRKLRKSHETSGSLRENVIWESCSPVPSYTLTHCGLPAVPFGFREPASEMRLFTGNSVRSGRFGRLGEVFVFYRTPLAKKGTWFSNALFSSRIPKLIVSCLYCAGCGHARCLRNTFA